jgi:hypothetical protein
VAQDSLARIVVLNKPHSESGPNGTTLVRQEWRYCLRNSGRYNRLVIAGQYYPDTGDIVTVGPVLLAGPYAAYTTLTELGAGRYGELEKVEVENLRTGHLTTALPPSDSTAICTGITCTPDALTVSPNGSATWRLEDGCVINNRFATCGWAIVALDARSGWQGELARATAAPGVAIEDPFSRPRIYSCAAGCRPGPTTIATWLRDGQAQWAPLQ